MKGCYLIETGVKLAITFLVPLSAYLFYIGIHVPGLVLFATLQFLAILYALIKTLYYFSGKAIKLVTALYCLLLYALLMVYLETTKGIPKIEQNAMLAYILQIFPLIFFTGGYFAISSWLIRKFKGLDQEKA